MDVGTFRRTVHADPIAPQELVDMILTSSVRPHHAQFVRDIALEHLEGRSGYFGRKEIRHAFQSCGYLAGFLREIYSNDPQAELHELIRVLRITYGHPIDQAAINEVLSNLRAAGSEPTAALCAAILWLSDRGDVTELVWRACYAYIRDRGFSAEAEGRLTTRLDQSYPLRSCLPRRGRL